MLLQLPRQAKLEDFELLKVLGRGNFGKVGLYVQPVQFSHVMSSHGMSCPVVLCLVQSYPVLSCLLSCADP